MARLFSVKIGAVFVNGKGKEGENRTYIALREGWESLEKIKGLRECDITDMQARLNHSLERMIQLLW